MRKIMTVVLAVLMLVSAFATIPASAAAATTDDWTTKDTEGLNKIVITEIAPKTTYHPNGAEESQDSKKFPMNFMELYNNGAGDINLAELSLLKGVNLPKVPGNTDPYYESATGEKIWNKWKDEKKFLSKMDLKAEAIVENVPSDVDSSVANFLSNITQDKTFSNGETVVLWFITPDTIEWMTNAVVNDSNNTFSPRDAFVKSFYGANESAANYTILMVWAWQEIDDNGSILDDMFALSAPSTEDRDYVFGIAPNTWDLANDAAYTQEKNADNKVTNVTINEDIYTWVVLGTNVPRYDKMPNVDKTATFGVPTEKPYLANKYEELTAFDPNSTEFSDGVEAGLVKSYRESSVIDWSCAPTPGKMPAWQWAMTAPESYDGFKVNGTYAEAEAKKAVDAYIKELGLDGDDTGREEANGPEWNFQTQDELREQFFGTGNKVEEEEEGGLTTLALILIIVGGVVLLGGAACVVIFVVVLPKKKAAAAAAVAEVPAAEEAPAAEAPAAEEAPVEEEAPAEEEAPTEE